MTRIHAADATAAPPPSEAPAKAAASTPVKAEGETVQMQQVQVVEQKAGAETAFADKSASDALTETISGAALKNPNAQSASDLLKNVSGVSVNQGADGSTSISMRGLDSRFVRVTVDGQRQGGGRNPLDSIPPEMIRSIEVSKALTPDQDADALGGAINVTTGTPSFQDTYVQGRHQIAVNSLDSRPSSRNSLTYGRPFAFFAPKPNAGLLLTASYDDQYRLREGLRDLREWPALVSPGPAPFTGTSVPVLTLPRIESTPEHRQRGSLVFNVSAQAGDSSITWRSNFSRDRAHRDRRVLDFDPSVGTPLALAPDHAVFSGVPQNRRDQRQNTQRDAANLLLGGKTVVGPVELEASLGAVLTDEREPRTVESVFRSDHTFRTSYDLRADPWLPQFAFVDETNPADGTSLSSPARYVFDSLSLTRTDTRDRDLAAKLDAKFNLGDGKDSSGFLKFGGKAQQRRRKADTDRTTYDPGIQRRDMGGLVSASEVALHDGGYRFEPIPDAEAVAALLATTPGVFQPNATETLVNSATGDYEATETIVAGYGMGRFKFDRWTLLGGIRFEETQVKASGRQIVLDAKGNVAGVTPAQTDRSYLEVLPGLHARFDPQPGWIMRSAVTRSLSRPNYSELAPTRQINFLDGRSRSGNPDLKPYAATNFDFSVDRYQERFGLLSVAVFFKKIDHFIADAQYPVTIGTLGQFIEFKRINGDSARVGGAEFGWQSVKWSMPAGLGSATVVTNYTFLHSDTRIPQRPGEVFSLSKQSTLQGNVTVSAERGRFSVDMTLRYRSKSLEDVIDPGLDNYRMGAFDAELSVVYKFTKDTRLTFGVNNLLNVPMREYAGLRSRVNAYERSGVDVNVGVQWKMPLRVGNPAGR